jgi:putative endonuclease
MNPLLFKQILNNITFPTIIWKINKTVNNNNFNKITCCYTNNLIERLEKHNSSKGAKFTRGKKWILIYSKEFLNKSEAMKEEYKLKKNYILRKKIKKEFLRNE